MLIIKIKKNYIFPIINQYILIYFKFNVMYINFQKIHDFKSILNF